MDLIVARGASRSWFPVYMRTVSIYSNNYRKLHGMPMMRNVHLRKFEKKRINKAIEDYIAAFLRRETNYILKEILEGIDLADYEQKALRVYPYWGQPVINQNTVVKIVTSGEEN